MTYRCNCRTRGSTFEARSDDAARPWIPGLHFAPPGMTRKALRSARDDKPFRHSRVGGNPLDPEHVRGSIGRRTVSPERGSRVCARDDETRTPHHPG